MPRRNNRRRQPKKDIKRYKSDYVSEPDINVKALPSRKHRRIKHCSSEAVFEIARDVFGVGYCPPKEENGQP